jgi:hypothetical protein
VVPRSSDEALAAAIQLNGGERRSLARWLKELEADDVDPSMIPIYAEVRCNPPWQRGECAKDLIVIFRAMTEEERARYRGADDHAPNYYVAFVVSPVEEPSALARLAAQIRDREDREKRQEKQGRRRKSRGDP